MAFSEVASRKATAEFSGTSTGSVAFAGNVTAGNLLVCVGNVWNDPQSTSIGVAGSLHTTGWTVYTVNIGTPATAWVAWKVATSSGAETVTVDPSGSQAWGSISVDEFTSGGTISLDTDHGSQTGSPTSTPTKNFTTTSATGLIVGVVGTDGADYPNPVAHSVGTGMTQFGEVEATDNATHNGAYQVTSAATNYSWVWTLGSSQVYGIYIASFKETAGGSDPEGLLFGGGKLIGGGFLRRGVLIG
jgi:hypothetical protein